MNRGTNKIRISKKNKKKLRAGDERAIILVTRPKHKFNNGIMVSGGICNECLRKIIFHTRMLTLFLINKFYLKEWGSWLIPNPQ